VPVSLTSLIGREEEVAAACARLLADGVRWLTLDGPGGVGKTRLALRIAEEIAPEFPDGVVFVPLAPLTDPELVLPAITRELGLQERATSSVTELLTTSLQSRRLLLVLDNVEQVSGVAPRVAALLERCPGVTVLATSRTRLRVSGEQRFPVAPLALPGEDQASSGRRDAEVRLATIADAAAVQLFVARAQAVAPGFVLDADNAPLVATICRRLDGLPLAIELAAVRLRLLTAAELLARLAPALPLLTDGPADAPDRLRTMRNAIAWSYALLTPDQQALLRRLSVFLGGCSLDAAAAVVGGGQQPSLARRVTWPADELGWLETMAALVDASLVRRQEIGGQTRVVMLETIREFAWEQLSASGELATVATRHAQWCIQLAEGVRLSGGLSRREGLFALETELPNLRAALRWLLAHGEATAALHLAGELAESWFRHTHLAEGRAWLEQALAAEAGPPTAARANALVGLAMLNWFRDGFARSDELLREGEAVARVAEDAGALAYARLHQGYVAFFRGDLEVAEARGREGLVTATAIPQGFSLNGVHWLLAEVALARGEDERAGEDFTQLLEMARTGGDEISVANALAGLATLAERRGDPAAALSGFADAAEVCRDSGDHAHAGYVLEQAAATVAATGNASAAVRLFAAADALRGVAEPASMRLNPGIPLRHEQALLAARASLGEDAFAALWVAGTALSCDAAIFETRALAGHLTVATLTGTTALPASARPLHSSLSPREREVLQLVADGLSDKEIADRLFIARRSASKYVSAILAKLDVPSRAAAAAIAVRDGLV
jgi:non-specific serine/threonine protein kinase